MSRRSTIIAAVVVGVAAAAVGVGNWYWLHSSDPSPLRTSDLNTSGTNRRFLLVPVKIPKQRPVVDVWQNLFTGLSKDQTSKAFLQRLYGGFPVEVVVAAPATDQPPGDGFSVVLRINPKAGETDWGKIVSQIGGPSDVPVECLLGRLDCTRVAKLRIAKTDPPAREAAAKVLEAQLINFDLDALVMAANEYLLREQMGWRMINGSGVTFDRLKTLSQDPAEVQRELDHQVEEWVKQYSQHGKDR